MTTLGCGRLERPRLMLRGIVWGLGHAATLVVLTALAAVILLPITRAIVRRAQILPLATFSAGILTSASGARTLWDARSG